MKRFILAGLIALSMAAHAQNTTVTATVVDTDGQAWLNGSWTAQLTLPGGAFSQRTPTVSGVAVPTSLSGSLDSAGHMSVTLTSTSALDQNGGQWTITACPNAVVQQKAATGCYAVTTFVTGATLDLSAPFATAPGPRFPAGVNSYGYSDMEVIQPTVPGTTYYNTGADATKQGLRVYNGKTWAGVGSGGASPAGSNLQIQVKNGTALGATNWATDATFSDLLGVRNLTTKVLQSTPQADLYDSTPATPSKDGLANALAATTGGGIIRVPNSYNTANVPIYSQYHDGTTVEWETNGGKYFTYYNSGGFRDSNIYGSYQATGHTCRWDTLANTTFNALTNINCGGYGLTNITRGHNFGNAPGATHLLGWSTSYPFAITGSFPTRGIKMLNSETMDCLGDGDCQANNLAMRYNGGQHEASGEGGHFNYLHLEYAPLFTATVSSTSLGANGQYTVGLTSPNNQQWTGDGMQVVDTTKSIAGNLTRVSGQQYTFTGATVASVCGTLTADLDTAAHPDGDTISTTFSVTMSTSGTFNTTLPLFIGGNSQFEHAIPTAITGTGPYTVTAPLQLPHRNGDTVCQGGTPGAGWSITYDDSSDIGEWTAYTDATGHIYPAYTRNGAAVQISRGGTRAVHVSPAAIIQDVRDSKTTIGGASMVYDAGAQGFAAGDALTATHSASYVFSGDTRVSDYSAPSGDFKDVEYTMHFGHLVSATGRYTWGIDPTSNEATQLHGRGTGGNNNDLYGEIISQARGVVGAGSVMWAPEGAVTDTGQGCQSITCIKGIAPNAGITQWGWLDILDTGDRVFYTPASKLMNFSVLNTSFLNVDTYGPLQAHKPLNTFQGVTMSNDGSFSQGLQLGGNGAGYINFNGYPTNSTTPSDTYGSLYGSSDGNGRFFHIAVGTGANAATTMLTMRVDRATWGNNGSDGAGLAAGDICYGNCVAKINMNTGAVSAASLSVGGVAVTAIANVQVAMPTTAIAANTCTVAATASMPGLTTTSTFTTAYASDPSAVTGWGSTGGLSFAAWPTANTLNWRVCNQTAASITPGALTLNVGAK